VAYVFDPAKDAINAAKHGVSLRLAEFLFAGRFVSQVDDRFDYNEMRYVAIGEIGGLVFVCVYVDRGEDRRVISLRRANKREVRRYEEAGQ
jgi:uncharacterized DUF497 family protein